MLNIYQKYLLHYQVSGTLNKFSLEISYYFLPFFCAGGKSITQRNPIYDLVVS
jgi:hypothetical protein